MADSRFEAVGSRVRQARMLAGFTQEQLANKLQIDRSAVSLIEQGKREINSLELRRISEALGYPMEYFIPDDEDVEDPTEALSQLEATFRADSKLGEEALTTLAWARLVLSEYANLKRLMGEGDNVEKIEP